MHVLPSTSTHAEECIEGMASLTTFITTTATTVDPYYYHTHSATLPLFIGLISTSGKYFATVRLSDALARWPGGGSVTRVSVIVRVSVVVGEGQWC